MQELLFLTTLFFSALFSASETAYTSLHQSQLHSLPGRTGRHIKRLLHLPGRVLGTVLIGNTLANIGASVIATQITIQHFDSSVLGITTGLLTIVILFFCELIPKQLAIVHNEKIAIFTVYPLFLLSWILFPFIKIFGILSKIIAKSASNTKSLSLQGMLSLVNEAEKTGLFSSYHSNIIHNSFRLSKPTVASIMTHRIMVQSLEASTSVKEFLSQPDTISFSRIPLYEENKENIIGIVHIKSILKQVAHPSRVLSELMYTPLYIPAHRNIPTILNLLLSKRQSMAIVLDEFGGLTGIVTLEDILEEIIGQVDDEYETPSKKKIISLENGSFIVQADISMSLFSTISPQDLEQEKYTSTLGGYLFQRIGRIPKNNERIHTPIGTFEIVSLVKNRIDRVVYIPSSSS